MRVSTAQFYHQSSLQIADLQSEVNNQGKYLASGKRVMTAKDDAVSFGTLSGYKDGLASIDKYMRNINQADNRNSLQEISYSAAEDVIHQLKQTFIQANNGTLSDEDLHALADLARNSQSEMIGIGNTKDETGGYIFSGYKIDMEPFSSQPDSSVAYNGDSGKRELQVANNVMVQTSKPGDEAFVNISNAIGDFSANYNTNTSGISVNRAVITDRGTYNAVTNPPDYNFNFSSATDLTVTDSLGNTVFTTAAYVPGQTIAFNGIEVQLHGQPLPGDDFDLTPEENISIFDTIKDTIDWMEAGVSSTNPAQRQVDYAEILNQLEEALYHVSAGRAEVGIRLKLTDNQKESHLDSELYLNSGKSNIEDLDFAKAIADFEQSKVSLDAAQQSFVQIKNLSLFNYL